MSSNPAADAVQGITETDIANYLAATPGFFERHAALLASVQLQHPHGARAVSLQERQAEMLRDKIKGLERRIMDMIRHSQDNEAIANRLHEWVHTVMRAHDERQHRVADAVDLNIAVERFATGGRNARGKEQGFHAGRFLNQAAISSIGTDWRWSDSLSQFRWRINSFEAR